jgi:HAD superfamily hydrolase (TIGR01509 family)
VTGVVKACLVDVWQTILYGDFEARVRALTEYAGVDRDTWLGYWLSTAVERDRGDMSIADSFAQSLLACGVDPRPELIADLIRKDAEDMRELVRLYDDAVPFFTGLRSQGIGIALVSNCGDTTRPILEHLGVIPLADAVILSCEVRSAKPSPEIYLIALEALGVTPAEAVFIDDQPSFCAGAQSVGVRPIQIARPTLDGPDGSAPTAHFPVVRSLLGVPALL